MNPKKKKLLIIWTSVGVGSLLLLGGGGFAFKKYAWPKYRDHQINSMNQEARSYLANKDYANAMLLARKSLQRKQDNIDAWRIAATAARERKLPEALFYQNQLTKVEPTKENYVEMLRLAIDYEQFGFALNVIKNAASIPANDPAWHKYAASVFKTVGRPLAAKYHLQMLVTINPSDAEAQLDLAAIELSEDKAGKNPQIRARLRTLADNPQFRSRALSLLLEESVREKRRMESNELLERLSVSTPLTLQQQLIEADAIRLCKPEKLPEFLAQLQKNHNSNAAEIVQLVDFLTRIGQTSIIFNWYPSLSEDLRNDEDVRRSVADAYFATKNWSMLQAHLLNGKWGKKEYLRHGLLAYAYRAQGRIPDFFENWKIAVMECGSGPRQAVELLGRADAWHWDNERFDVVWKLFNLLPENEQIRQQLFEYEYRNKNTANINRIFARLLEVDETDAVAMNNYSYTSFLLDSNLTRASYYAELLYKTNPKDPFFISSEAFNLYKQGKSKEALAMLETLRPAALSEPERMALHAFLLAKNGNTAKAAEIIPGIVRTRLMPEEVALIEQAEQEISHLSKTREYTSRVLAINQSRSSEAAETSWMQSLRPETRSNSTSAMQLADSLYSIGDYKGMEQLLADDDWQDLNYLRQTLLCFCDRNRGESSKARDHWSAAFTSVRRNVVALENLRALASKWGWTAERMEVLNALFEQNPGDRILLAELLEHQRAAKKTTEILRLLNLHQSDKNPGAEELVLLCYYNLILGSDISRSTVKTKGLFEAEPDNNDLRNVYALSLVKQGRAEEAVKVLNEGGNKAGRISEICVPLIQAMAFTAAGNAKDAESALTSINAEKLLPEEKDAVQKAADNLKKLKQPSA